MPTLILNHLGDNRFQVSRPDGKHTDPVTLTAPDTIQVAGRPDSTLTHYLRWYLEKFLDYPFSPETEVAERVQAALRAWGEQAFLALFGSGRGRDFYRDAYREGLQHLTLKISSDNPRVLAWPWEVLRDPEAVPLAHACQIERQLSAQYDPLALPDSLPRDRINILLITARPFEADVGFRTLSRPLLDLIEKDKLPAQVEMLRPPTFEQLQTQLRERPGYYHIVHFDGHGGYGPESPTNSHQLQGHQGRLIFEDADSKAAAIDAKDLATLLHGHRIPIMVLNACQSAMIDGSTEGAFASVAAVLQRAGVRSVVAMAYSLYVSAAVHFIPAFYRRLFESGSVTEAVRAGRQALLKNKQRVCARGLFPLEDWLVPVVYQQDPADLPFSRTAAVPQNKNKPSLPAECQAEELYGFIGRDSALLALERALLRPPAGILIHGLGGVGKTTLAKGFVRWLRDTDGLGLGCFWFTFNDIRSSEYVFNRLIAPLFGDNALATPQEQKLAALVKALRENQFLIVWDNFESVAGNPDAGIAPLLSDSDRAQLRDFLTKLCGGKTKVLITSRSQESAWLNREYCYRLPLGGLRGEERWNYCNTIVRDLGLNVDRTDKELNTLMDMLDGHPLAMRAMLVQLADHGAATLVARLRQRVEASNQDEAEAKLFATLSFVEESLSTELRPLLIPLGLHERFVDADYLEVMAKTAQASQDRQAIDRLLNSLEIAGLVHPLGQNIYSLHPALTGFLRARKDEAGENWRRAFVDVMGSLADHYAPKALHEQRTVFFLHGSNFYHALMQSEQLGMNAHFAALTQALAAYAQNSRNFIDAKKLFENLANHCKAQGEPNKLAAAYHQLGMIVEEQRDFGAAKDWYLKSLAISKKLGNEHAVTSTYHQLGMIAEEQHDFGAAKDWYLKSLAISEKLGNELGAASTYHQLGMIAEEQRDFGAAKDWYLKSLAISEVLGNEHYAASTYHQLGRIAQEQRDFGAAKDWYLKSLAISEKLGIDHYAAIIYHQLGMIAEEQRDFGAAKDWYLKSLAIKEKLGNELGAASTYHQLGRIAQEQRDFGAAKDWYLKSLAISEKLGNELGAASTYGQLGILARTQQYYVESGRRLIKAIHGFANTHAPHFVQQAMQNFIITYNNASPADQATLQQLWAEAQLGPFPDPNTAAASYPITTLQTHIPQLADADAQRILTLFVTHQPGYARYNPDPHLSIALSKQSALSDGDLARLALLLLADNPANNDVLTALINGPQPKSFGLVESAAVLGAVLFVLGTHVHIERDKDGRWFFKIEKKPTNSALLQTLLEKLSSFWNSNNP